MTRGKQIIEEAKRIIAEAHERGGNDPMVDLAITLFFSLGARWADAHPISDDGKAALYFNNIVYENGYKEAVDKACEWLDCYIYNYLFIDAENKSGIKWDNFINDFRKAMKSGSSEFPNNCEKGGEE